MAWAYFGHLGYANQKTNSKHLSKYKQLSKCKQLYKYNHLSEYKNYGLVVVLQLYFRNGL